MLHARWLALGCVVVVVNAWLPAAEPTRRTATYRATKAYLDSVPAIDTHDHLAPFEHLTQTAKTERGAGMNLYAVWKWSYYPIINPLTPWTAGQPFDAWWNRAKHDFRDARGTSFYRYMLPAFSDLYGVDFERITDEQARELDQRIFENYRDPRWLYHVITERANIELVFTDPYWAPLAMKTDYPFVVLVLNINPLFRAFHPSEVRDPVYDPYHFAREQGMRMESLDDYVAVIDRLIVVAKERGAACLKQTLAYQRTLDFANVPKERAAVAFGRPRSELTPAHIRDFEDFLMWRIAELAGRHDLPIQIHTGQARIQGSNPMLLVDLIEANPKTKFVLFHGGFPWVGETGAIAMRFPTRVWIDSVWLPTLSYTMAKRAFHEWLEVMPSNRIMWGADSGCPEGVYAATEFTRRCLAEVLAEKVDAGDLLDEDARHIGRQILRENALSLFPQIKDRLWKKKGRLEPPAPATTQAATLNAVAPQADNRPRPAT